MKDARIVKIAAVVFSMLVSFAPYSQERIKVKAIALFEDRAMLSINGTRAKIINVGQSFKGVTLISSNTSEAVVDVSGVRETLTLNSGAVLTKSLASKPIANPNDPVQIWQNEYGRFESLGYVNGQSLDFLVDTGADLVVLSSAKADSIGLEYENGQFGIATTASGQAQMYLIELEQVSLGSIELSNVEAGVIIGSYPTTPLLGMSFLRHLDMNRSGNVMVLRKRSR